MSTLVDTLTASRLSGEGIRRVQEKATRGLYAVEKESGKRGGISGVSNLVDITSLSLEAQINYWLQQSGHATTATADCDLTGYRAHFGEAGLQEVLNRQHAAIAGLAIRSLNTSDVLDKLNRLAVKNDVTLRTLYRWMDGYKNDGLPGIMKRVHRKDKGIPKTLCLFAQDYIRDQYLAEVKRTQQTVFEKLCLFAESLGDSACARCPYNDCTSVRDEMISPDKPLPLCADAGRGLIIPAHRSAINKFIASIPAGEKTMGRRGVRYWEARHMPMAKRDKPQRVNECWFGDHHQFDMFVLDSKGNAVRAWVTAWYDAATGMLVGWRISTNPNSTTIADSFADAVAEKVGSPICGVPSAVYIDNSKDYLSKRFEGSTEVEVQLGRLNTGIDKAGLLQALGVRVYHAIPYRAWSKTVERFFGTLEDKWIRELPGWCGNSPTERPQDFGKELRTLVESGQLMTLDEFAAHFENVILPEYHARAHDGDTQSPAELYATLEKARTDIPSYAVLAAIKEKSETRKVTPTGIKFRNAWYWHPELADYIGTEVTIKYNEGDTASVTVMHDSVFIAQAELKRSMRLIGEDEDVLAAHMAEQSSHRKKTRASIRQSREVVRRATADQAGPVVNTAGKGTYTDINAEKRQRAVQETEAKRNRPRRTNDPVREKLMQDGRALGASS